MVNPSIDPTRITGQEKPALSGAQIINMAVGFFGIQMAFALQNANASRIFETMGANVADLAFFWLAGPLTGLIVQPIVGHFSDNIWTRFGRRRPFFLAGAIWAAAALIFMPNAPALWMAVASLWVLDAAINISMEPFRAFVGDLLPSRQRTAGYAMQTFFIGAGGLLGSWLPFLLTKAGVSNVAAAGQVPTNVIVSFVIGAGILLISVIWTVVTTKEYPPEVAAAYNAHEEDLTRDHNLPPARRKPPRFFGIWGVFTLLVGLIICALVYTLDLERDLWVLGGGVAVLGVLFIANGLLRSNASHDSFFSHILDDLVAMPRIMKQLAVVQFFSWVGFFVMWIYSTPAIAARYFGTSDPATQAYQDAGDWVGILFGVYSLVSALYAFVLPVIARHLGLRRTHAIGLLLGALGLASYGWFTDPKMLLLTMICIGAAWGSVLTMPYAILSNGIPPKKMGIYMGIFNFFIVLPQLVVATIMGTILSRFLGGETIDIFAVGAVTFVMAAISLYFVDSTRHKWDPNYAADEGAPAVN